MNQPNPHLQLLLFLVLSVFVLCFIAIVTGKAVWTAAALIAGGILFYVLYKGLL